MKKIAPLLTRPRTALRAALAAALLLGAAGCATLTFKAKREARFVNMDGEFIRVDYGEEKRTETLPNGLVCTFNAKVRVTLPDGKRVVLYQALSPSGVRYLSASKHYEFIEKGPVCKMSRDGRTLFEGIHCRK
jgi:hypothetical protein